MPAARAEKSSRVAKYSDICINMVENRLYALMASALGPSAHWKGSDAYAPSAPMYGP